MDETELILDLLDDWEQMRAHGVDISAEELCDDPAIVLRLREEINLLRRMDWMDRSLETSLSERRQTFHQRVGDLLENRYELLRKLGEGGFAIVWLAQDILLDEIVALKIPHSHEGRAGSECAWREFRTANPLCHQHIVPIIRMGDHRGNFFIVLEYVNGQTLADRIRSGPIEPNEAVRIVREVATVLAFIHRRGLIHCDLKPSNILLDRNGRSYVTDFGISLRTAFGQSIVPKTTAGTLRYMAPEQTVSKLPIDSRCDIYALGLILFEMLTGKRPFAVPLVPKPGNKAHIRNAPRPSSIQPGIPQYLDWVIDWCLKSDPGNRYFSANELLEKLDHPEWPRRKARPWREWERVALDNSSKYRGLGVPHPAMRMWYRASNWISDRIYFAKVRLDNWVEPFIRMAKQLARHAAGFRRCFDNLWTAWYESVFALLVIATVLAAVLLPVSFVNLPRQPIPEDSILVVIVCCLIIVCFGIAIYFVRHWRPLLFSMFIMMAGVPVYWNLWPHGPLRIITTVLDPTPVVKSTKN